MLSQAAALFSCTVVPAARR